MLLAADLHGSQEAVATIKKNIQRFSPDLLVICGDITHFGPVGFTEELFRDIAVRTFAVPGNCDPPEMMRRLEALGVNIHAKKVRLDNLTFVGLGGSNLTPFDTYIEFSEEDIKNILNPLMERGVILISHAPPFGTMDVVQDGTHVGSRMLKRFIDEFPPLLVITGHIHEARGISRNETTVVNPGPAYNGNLAIATIDDGVSVDMI